MTITKLTKKEIKKLTGLNLSVIKKIIQTGELRFVGWKMDKSTGCEVGLFSGTVRTNN